VDALENVAEDLRQQARPQCRTGVRDTLAELLQEIDGTTRGLPNQDLMVTLPDPLEDEDDAD
jgi:hypothetical protein